MSLAAILGLKNSIFIFFLQIKNDVIKIKKALMNIENNIEFVLKPKKINNINDKTLMKFAIKSSMKEEIFTYSKDLKIEIKNSPNTFIVIIELKNLR